MSGILTVPRLLFLWKCRLHDEYAPFRQIRTSANRLYRLSKRLPINNPNNVRKGDGKRTPMSARRGVRDSRSDRPEAGCYLHRGYGFFGLAARAGQDRCANCEKTHCRSAAIGIFRYGKAARETGRYCSRGFSRDGGQYRVYAFHAVFASGVKGYEYYRSSRLFTMLS